MLCQTLLTKHGNGIAQSIGPAGIRPPGVSAEGNLMSKGDNQRGNKEKKKPKQEKPKVVATADSQAGKAGITVSGKKVK